MFNRMTGAVLGLALVFSLTAYSFAFAETTGQDYAILQNLQAKIQELQGMINALKAQLAARQSTSSKVPVYWTSGLKPGHKDTEKLGQVLKLQVLLKEKSYADFVPTGYYGPKTAEAVKRLQQELGILPPFKSPGVTEKEEYLKKLEEQKIIQRPASDTSTVFVGVTTGGGPGQPHPTVTGSGQFDPCFVGTETLALSIPAPDTSSGGSGGSGGTLTLTNTERIDKCVQDKLGYGVVGPKTIAGLQRLAVSAAPTLLSAGCQAGDAYSRTTGQVCTTIAPIPTVPNQPGRGRECKGDMNQDGVIDFQDIDIYRDVWETMITNWFADIDDNGGLNQRDIDLFVGILSGTVEPICR